VKAAVINQTYALSSGLNPVRDAIIIEGKDSPYANIVAVRTGDENRPEIKTLNDTLRSPEVKQFLLDHFKGSLVPSF
jgi:D-methionine transport system substrate-binding protein